MNRQKLVSLSVGGVAVVACLALAAGPLAARPSVAAPRQPQADLSRFAEAGRAESPLSANKEAALVVRAGHVRAALGFPTGSRHNARHVRSGLEKAQYDEVADFASDGTMTSITQFDSKGRLRAAIRFDNPRGGRSVGREEATRTAQRAARSLDLTLGNAVTCDADEATGGWTVRWPRQQGGVPVRGDEANVLVWPDGQIQSVALVEHDLAAVPAETMGQDQAKQLVSDNADAWFAGNDVQYSIRSIDLEWVEPNGAFDPSLVTADDVPLRLAWVAEIKPLGPAANYVGLICVFVDAGDGRIIGGDFVE
jgi:hypothetical protein